jgi:hypothetical protein
VEKKLRARLVFHGAIVILLGMLAGFPYAFVIMGTMEGDLRAWRMAHLEGVMNGLLCLAAAGVFRRLSLSAGQQRLMTWSFILMGYGNVIASIIGASTGERGLQFAAPAANMVVFSLFTVAIVAVFLGLGLLAYGARPSTRGMGGDVIVEVKSVSAPSAGSSSASRARSSAVSRSVDVEVSVSKSGTSAAPDTDADDDMLDEDDDDDRPMNRAERRRSKKK